jgi:type I restriction enzyme, R subunit
VLVAFSGTVSIEGDDHTETSFNEFPESQTAQRFGTDEWHVLVVAEKYHTGFDQPLLCTMYVDKSLTGLAARSRRCLGSTALTTARTARSCLQWSGRR